MASKYIKNGTRLIMPSGSAAQFQGWRVRRISKEKNQSDLERVAVLKLLTDDEEILVSERFISLCTQATFDGGNYG